MSIETGTFRDINLTVRNKDDPVEDELSKGRWGWKIFSYALTFYLPMCLICCLSDNEKRAFRQKLAIVMILVLASLVFSGIYAFIPIIICHQPPFYAFLFLVHKQDIFCFWYSIALLAFFGLIGIIILMKMIAAIYVMITTQVASLRNKYVIINIPSYTEGEESMRKTIDSTANLFYPNKHKLLFIVCDGLVTGAGNSRSTPDIVLSIMGRRMEDCHDFYLYKSLNGPNRAKVFTGMYREVPYVIVIKSENRGKRDSQIILLSLLHRLFYRKKMTPLEQKICSDIENILKMDPHRYELLLSVDSDTQVDSRALEYLAAPMEDPDVIAVCGETRVSNKWSLIPMIQVYEYWINHQLNKAFESAFSTLTCLPGCFTLYRIKSLPIEERGHLGALRGKQSNPYQVGLENSRRASRIPVDGKPYLIMEPLLRNYSNRNVNSLHTKNLLSLGEDRWLTSLLIRFFPTGKTKYVPKAICYTTVPHTFCMLLSQQQ